MQQSHGCRKEVQSQGVLYVHYDGTVIQCMKLDKFFIDSVLLVSYLFLGTSFDCIIPGWCQH